MMVDDIEDHQVLDDVVLFEEGKGATTSSNKRKVRITCG